MIVNLYTRITSPPFIRDQASEILTQFVAGYIYLTYHVVESPLSTRTTIVPTTKFLAADHSIVDGIVLLLLLLLLLLRGVASGVGLSAC